MFPVAMCTVESGSRTLKDAINEAMRDWVTNIETTHYLIGMDRTMTCYECEMTILVLNCEVRATCAEIRC